MFFPSFLKIYFVVMNERKISLFCVIHEDFREVSGRGWAGLVGAGWVGWDGLIEVQSSDNL